MSDHDRYSEKFNRIVHGAQSLSEVDRKWLDAHSEQILSNISGQMKELNPLLSAKLSSIMRRRLDKENRIIREAHQEQEISDVVSGLVLFSILTVAVAKEDLRESLHELLTTHGEQVLASILGVIGTTKGVFMIREWLRRAFNNQGAVSVVAAALEEDSPSNE